MAGQSYAYVFHADPTIAGHFAERESRLDTVGGWLRHYRPSRISPNGACTSVVRDLESL